METGMLVSGRRELCRDYLRANKGYYVYILRRPDGRPFYVGKGTGDRVFSHENRARHPNDHRSNSYKLNVIRSIWRAGGAVTYEIDHIGIDESYAYLREAELIGSLRRLHEGGPLTNRDPGGGSTAGRAPISSEKHAATLGGIPLDNDARAALNRFALGIGPMRSVILKPVEQFTVRPTQRYPGRTMKPTFRQAVALAASAAANGIILAEACEIPRTATVDGVRGFVENGVSCDILTSSMAEVAAALIPADERFILTAEQARSVVNFVGVEKCVDIGVLASETFKRPR